MEKTNVKSFGPILDRAEKLLKAGNLRKSYDLALDGIQECSQVHRMLNEYTQGWDVKKAFDYKRKFKTQGKSLTKWMEDLYNVIESSGCEPIQEDFETDMIQYDVYGNVIPAHLREENKNS
jgi:hypothetical protein